MFEQDYVMREIRTMIRAVMKAVFNVDTEETPLAFLERQGRMMDDGTFSAEIIALARQERFRDAENALFAHISPDDYGMLRLGLAFYDYLSLLDPDTLAAHGYDPDTLADGLRRLLTAYGLEAMSNLFLL
ncbi:MAG: hypothetical protein IK130_10665 [Oscillospiraceae bacterium]|nr:hypothetical protein [Oscillospiraceae bacterium]